MNGNIQTVLTSTCPICHNGANSPHHIKPLNAGGKDEPRNKVWLCKRCHDIVEMIYSETGLEYSPALVYHIRREFNLGKPVREPFIRLRYRPSGRKKSIFSFRDDTNTAVKWGSWSKVGTCAFCGHEFERTKPSQVLCRKCVRKNSKKPTYRYSTAISLLLEADLKEVMSLKQFWRHAKVQAFPFCYCIRCGTTFIPSQRGQGERWQHDYCSYECWMNVQREYKEANEEAKLAKEEANAVRQREYMEHRAKKKQAPIHGSELSDFLIKIQSVRATIVT